MRVLHRHETKLQVADTLEALAAALEEHGAAILPPLVVSTEALVFLSGQLRTEGVGEGADDGVADIEVDAGPQKRARARRAREKVRAYCRRVEAVRVVERDRRRSHGG